MSAIKNITIKSKTDAQKKKLRKGDQSIKKCLFS